MSYVLNNLTKDETILLKASVSWAIFLVPSLIFVLFFISSDGATDPILKVIVYGFSIYFFIKSLIYYLTTEFAVTNKRVIGKFGWISRKTFEIEHKKVEGLNLEQSITGRILNFGTIIINGTGSGKTPIKTISHPLEFRKKALEIIQSE